jgi:hypothetical protein
MVTFGRFYDFLVFSWPFGTFCGYLVPIFFPFWFYVFIGNLATLAPFCSIVKRSFKKVFLVTLYRGFNKIVLAAISSGANVMIRVFCPVFGETKNANFC